MWPWRFTARCLTTAAEENGRLLPWGRLHRDTRGWEGGQGLEITCWWGSLEPLCKHGRNENKVGCFFFFLWRPVWHPSTTLQAELHAPFQKGTTVQEIGSTRLIQCWLCAQQPLSTSVVFLQWGYKVWPKKKKDSDHQGTKYLVWKQWTRVTIFIFNGNDKALGVLESNNNYT